MKALLQEAKTKEEEHLLVIPLSGRGTGTRGEHLRVLQDKRKPQNRRTHNSHHLKTNIKYLLKHLDIAILTERAPLNRLCKSPRLPQKSAKEKLTNPYKQ